MLLLILNLAYADPQNLDDLEKIIQTNIDLVITEDLKNKNPDSNCTIGDSADDCLKKISQNVKDLCDIIGCEKK